MLRNESQRTIKVDINNSRIKVAGRNYEANHVLIIGAKSLEAVLEPGSVKVRAVFDAYPQIQSPDMHAGEVVTISRAGSHFEMDTYGDKIKSIEESGNTIKIKGDLISLKFEMDDEYMVLKIPGKGRVKGTRLLLSCQGDVSLNMITMPFTVGIVSVKNGEGEIRIKGDEVEVVLAENVR